MNVRFVADRLIRALEPRSTRPRTVRLSVSTVGRVIEKAIADVTPRLAGYEFFHNYERPHLALD